MVLVDSIGGETVVGVDGLMSDDLVGGLIGLVDVHDTFMNFDGTSKIQISFNISLHILKCTSDKTLKNQHFPVSLPALSVMK